MAEGIILFLIGLLSWAGTEAMRRYALKKSLLDIPNHRSSHARPTPRGGGIGFVIAMIAGILWMLPDPVLLTALLPPLISIAALGFLDDRLNLGSRVRLGIQTLCCLWLTAMMQPVMDLPLFGTMHDLGFWGWPLTILGLLWLVNLTNFMDGIDGIAALQSLSVSIGGGLLWFMVTPPDHLAHGFIFLVVSAALLGFLIHNWPPARIFMGDAGSNALGLITGFYILYTAPAISLWAWLTLNNIFILDATLTLLDRLRRGKRLAEAHREHAYQVAARRTGSHLKVDLGVLALNFLWLLPLAALIQIFPGYDMYLYLFSAVPLVFLKIFLRKETDN